MRDARRPLASKRSVEFAALDVETANADPSTICQVGIATVRRGGVTDVWSRLVRPESSFDVRHTRIHGIDAATVAHAPRFRELYHKCVARLPPIVATHTRFDIGALVQSCRRDRLRVPRRMWLDSAKVARFAWPRLFRRGHCALSSVAAYLGIRYRPHDAGEDARAAAEVILAAQSELGLSTSELAALIGTGTLGRPGGKGRPRHR